MLWFLILLCDWKEATSWSDRRARVNLLAGALNLLYSPNASVVHYFSPSLSFQQLCWFSWFCLQNTYGGLHGGSVAALAERVAIGCARTVMREDKEPFLGELSISYLSSAPQNVCFCSLVDDFQLPFDTNLQLWISPLLTADDFLKLMLIGLATCLFCVVRAGHWCFSGEDWKKCDCSWGQFQIEKVWKACLHYSSHIF